MNLRFPVWRLHGGSCGPAFSPCRVHQPRTSLQRAPRSVGPHMTSSFVILDREAIYGYVSGSTQEGARGEREAEGKRQRDRKRDWRDRTGDKETRARVGEMTRGKKRRKRGKMKRDDGEKKGKGRGRKQRERIRNKWREERRKEN